MYSFICLLQNLYNGYKELMKKTDNLNHVKPNPYNFEIKESGSAKESEIMKCGWPNNCKSCDNHSRSLGLNDEKDLKVNKDS